MVYASYKRLLFLHICWSLASDNFNEIQIRPLEGNVLGISCGVTNGASDSQPIRMSIFADTPNNTLVSVLYKECPKVEGSAKDKHIYLPNCIPNQEKMFLDIVLTNHNPTENQTFGCNYTRLLVGAQISHSVSLAAVTSPGTPSYTERDDTSVDADGETWGRRDTLLLVAIALHIVLVALTCLVLLRIHEHKYGPKSGKTAQAKSKTLESSKHDEREEIYAYTDIKTTLRPDYHDECTDVIEGSSSLEIDKYGLRLKSANLSPEIINIKEECQGDNPYTQVNK